MSAWGMEVMKCRQEGIMDLLVTVEMEGPLFFF
jgi:hypothetical protein